MTSETTPTPQCPQHGPILTTVCGEAVCGTCYLEEMMMAPVPRYRQAPLGFAREVNPDGGHEHFVRARGPRPVA